MPETIDHTIPPCLDVPKKRWGWHWKQFERARFPSYNRNRALFGRMLNRMYEGATDSFQQALTLPMGFGRAEDWIERNGGDIIEQTYRTAYQNTALEFARGFQQNIKQEEDEEEDLATLTALAVRDFLTAALFANEQRQLTLTGQVNRIINTHKTVASSVLREQARAVLGVGVGQPLPNATPEQINQIALAARNRFRNQVTPSHSRFFSTTETVAASNLGILAVARVRQQRTGQQLAKMWLSQRDERVRDSHVITDSTLLPLDGLFNIRGSFLAFPGDWTHGAAISTYINCRCVLIFFRQTNL